MKARLYPDSCLAAVQKESRQTHSILTELISELREGKGVEHCKTKYRIEIKKLYRDGASGIH